MLSYFFLYDVKPRPPFLAPFKDTSTQIEGGKEYVNSPKCSTFPIEWIPLNCRDDWVINQCGEVKIISLLLFFIRISNKLGKNALLKHIACTTLVVHGWVFEGVSEETGVHFYSYEGFAYIKVEKTPHILGLNRTVRLERKRQDLSNATCFGQLSLVTSHCFYLKESISCK